MRMLVVSEFCETGSGGTPNRANQMEYYDGGSIPWIKSGELNCRTVTYAEEYITQKGLEQSSAKLLKPGAILVAMYGATVGQVAHLGIPAATNQAVCHIYPDQKFCETDYLYWFLKGAKKKLLAKRVGGGQPNISQRVIREFKIPLPPLAEQQRIARILDAADALRAARRQALAHLNALLQSAFLDLFGDPVTNPKGWEVKSMPDVVEGRYGIKAGPFGSALKKEEYTDYGYRVYGQEQVIAGRFDIGNYYIDEKKFQKLKACEVKAGDILVSLVGSYGKVLIVPEGIEPGIINPRLLKITPNQNVLTSLYLATVIQSAPVQSKLASMSHGGTMGILNAGLLKQLCIPIPHLDLQRRFAAIVEAVERQKSRQRTHLAELDTLFAALQQRAFAGEL